MWERPYEILAARLISLSHDLASDAIDDCACCQAVVIQALTER
jgi:hypothetical protein